MGVTGLWELVSPAARRVTPASLEGKILAVDSSIWMVQFLKAMREGSGAVKGAHLIGFFRRICKLLYYGIRPVFVFDGTPPPLKLKTLMRRRQAQESNLINLKKTAEKLILTQLKLGAVSKASKRSKIKTRENPQATEKPATKKPATTETNTPVMDGESNKSTSGEDSQNHPDCSVCPSEDEECLDTPRSSTFRVSPTPVHTAPSSPISSSYEDNEDEALSNASLHRGFLAQRRRLDDISIDQSGLEGLLSMPGQRRATKSSGIGSTEAVDQGGLAALRKAGFHASSVFRIPEEFKEYSVSAPSGEERFVQIPLDTSIDPEVFSQLPPKLQYSILHQLRDAWLNETRFQAAQAKDDSAVFSNVQIESFIRHVHTSKEIAKVKRVMAAEVHARVSASSAAAHVGPSEQFGPRSCSVQNDLEGEGDNNQKAPVVSGVPPVYEESLFTTDSEGLYATKRRKKRCVTMDKEDAVGNRSAVDRRLEGVKALFLTRRDVRRSTTANLTEHSGFPTIPAGGWAALQGDPRTVWSQMRDALKSHDTTIDNDQATVAEGKTIPGTDRRSEQKKPLDLLRPHGGEPTPKGSHATEAEFDLERETVLFQELDPLDLFDAGGSFSSTPPCMQNVSPERITPRYTKRIVLQKKQLSPAPAPSETVFEPCVSEKEDDWESVPFTMAAFRSPITGPSPLRVDDSKVLAMSSASTNVIPTNVTATDCFPVDIIAPGGVSADITTTGGIGKGMASTNDIPEDMTPTDGISEESTARDDIPVDITFPISISADITPTDDTLAQSNSANVPSTEENLVMGIHSPSFSPRISFCEADGDLSRVSPAILEDGVSEIDNMRQDVSDSDVVAHDIPEIHGTENMALQGASFKSNADVTEVQTTVTKTGGEELKNTSLLTSPRGSGTSPHTTRDDAAMRDLSVLAEELMKEKLHLETELRSYRRDTDEVTPEMQEEVRHLLSLFGLPFVDAPAEAEAQCAILTQLGLCDGVISDDSDSLVFGAREVVNVHSRLTVRASLFTDAILYRDLQVYRRFFESKNSIERHAAQEILRHMNINQSELILIAMLLGCDYTAGVTGIGIVNSLETVRVFNSLEALKELRAWATDPARVRGPGIRETDSLAVKEYKEAHQRYRYHWVFPEDFPNIEVVTCFTEPVVNRSRETFTWGTPDAEAVIRFLTRTTNLDATGLLDTLQPVLNRLEARARRDGPAVVRQSTITQFFHPITEAERVAHVRSRRIKKVLPQQSPQHGRKPRVRCQRRDPISATPDTTPGSGTEESAAESYRRLTTPPLARTPTIVPPTNVANTCQTSRSKRPSTSSIEKQSTVNAWDALHASLQQTEDLEPSDCV